MAPECMTVEKCNELRGECFDKREEKLDKLFSLANATAINVARIMGHLGLNGSGDGAMYHRRDSEQEQHEHRRAADALLDAVAKATTAMNSTVGAKKRTSWIRENWWIIVITALAGERVLTEVAKLLGSG